MRWFGRDKKKSSNNVAPQITPSSQPMSNQTVNQAWQNPRGLQPGQVQQLQSVMGNRSLGYLLGRHRADDENLQPNRYQFTMVVQAGDENFISKSTTFTINKYARKMGLPLPKMTPPKGTGHAWVVMKALHDNILLDNNSYGFTPGGFRDPDPYRDTSGDDVIYKDHDISEQAYERIQERLMNIKQKSESGELKYNVLGYNCTAFVRDIAKTAKVPFPGSKVLPFAFHGPASAFTPNKLHKALKKQQKKNVPGMRHHPLPEGILQQGSWVERMLENARARRAAQNGGVVDPEQEARMARLAALMNDADNDIEVDGGNTEAMNDNESDMDMDELLESLTERRVEEEVGEEIEEEGQDNKPMSGGLSEEMRRQLAAQFGIMDDEEDILESVTERQVEGESGSSMLQSEAPPEKRASIVALLDMLDEEGVESELEEELEEEESYQEDEESEEEFE